MDPIVMALRDHRQTQGIEADALAERIGVAPYSLWRWESAAVTPQIANLRAWAEALGFGIELVRRG